MLAYCALASYEDYDNLRTRVRHWQVPGTTTAAADGVGAATGAASSGPTWQWIKAWNFEHVKHDDVSQPLLLILSRLLDI